MMHGREKSDFAIVAGKPTNKAERSAAESVEPRAETKGNVGDEVFMRSSHGLRDATRTIQDGVRINYARFIGARRGMSSPGTWRLSLRCTKFRRDGRYSGHRPTPAPIGAQIIFRIRSHRRVEHEGDPVDARCDLLEKLQPLATKRAFDSGETGGVSARPRQARHKTAADGISNGRLRGL